jgi:hypothetical protein
MSTAPQTLPANFTGWDQAAQPPATLPANFSQWDDQKSAQQPPAAPDSAASRFGSNLASGAGVTSTEGAKQFFTHPLDVLKAMAQQQGELGVRAKNELANKDYVRGLTHAVEYLMPGLGPNLAQAGDQLQKGDIAGGVGRTLGAAIPIAAASPEIRAGAVNAAKTAISPITKQAPELYQSALKPSTTLPLSKKAAIVDTGLQNEVPVTAGGARKLQLLINDLSDKVKATIDADPMRPINKYAVASRLADTAQKFQTQVTPEADLAAVSDTGNEFLRNQPAQIPAAQAQAMKSGTYQQLGNKAYGELKSASIESQKALARGLKEEIAKQFPELSDLNAKEGSLLDLQPVLEKAVQRIGNHQLMGIGTPLVGTAAKAVTGSSGEGAASAVIKFVLDNPSVKSRLAIQLSKASRGTLTIPAAQARIAAYSGALAQAASSPSGEAPGDRTNGQTN